MLSFLIVLYFVFAAAVIVNAIYGVYCWLSHYKPEWADKIDRVVWKLKRILRRSKK